MAAAWAWAVRDSWNPLDLRTVGWFSGVASAIPFTSIAVALPAVVLAVALLIGVIRGQRYGGRATPWRVAAWIVPMLVAPMILYTTAVLANDYRKTPGWTLTRQNLQSLSGRAGCGLASDAEASLWSSAKPLAMVAGPNPVNAPSWIPPSPVPGAARLELSSTRARTPWFRLPRDRRLGLFVAGAGIRPGSLALQWGRARTGSIEVLGSDGVGGLAPRIASAPWTFVAASELPRPDPRATVVRLAVPQAGAPGAPIGVTAPVTYRTERLADALEEQSSPTLVHPTLVLYFPCARQPALRSGAVEVPRYFVWFDQPFQPHPYEATSPFAGVHDLFAVQRVPLADSARPPAGVVVYEVDRRVPGGAVAAPDSSETAR